MNITADIATVLSNLLTLGDIFALRLTHSQLRALFPVPPLLTFTDLSGNIICARRHNRFIIVLDDRVDIHEHICWLPIIGGAGAPSAPSVRGFPVLVFESYEKDMVRHIKKIFGALAVGLPIYVIVGGGPKKHVGVITPAAPGTPLADCALVVSRIDYNVVTYVFVAAGDHPTASHFTRV